MRPLQIALMHRDQWYRWQRVDGQFAYPVPEFEFWHFPVSKWFTANLADYADFDLVWWDDGKYRGGPVFFNPPPGPKRQVPVAYYCLYPTLNDAIYQSRKQRVRDNVDLLLLDHDDPARWQDLSIPVRRCAYSVDETRYKAGDGERDIDVGFYSVWNYSPERKALSDWLAGYCERCGWRYLTNGGTVRQDYPQLLARTKVVVHLNRTLNTRPPRIFDASACGAVVLASRMPAVSGEQWVDGQHYVAFDKPTAVYHDEEVGSVEPYTDADCAELATALDWLLPSRWRDISAEAQRYVLSAHTWRTRSQELRQTLHEALKL